MERLDSKIVVLNDRRYLVYLKKVAVKSSMEGQKFIIKAFVKNLGRKRKSKLEKFVNNLTRFINTKYKGQIYD